MSPLILVACCKTKRGRPSSAAHLYTSDLFQKSRAWAEAQGCPWLILSARHHVLAPTQIVAPYDDALEGRAEWELRVWANCVRHSLRNRGFLPARVIFLAGERYREHLAPLLVDEEGCTVEVPMQGLGIGKQRAWLNAALKEAA